MTIKTKLVPEDNYNRIEVDLGIKTGSREDVAQFFKLLNISREFSIRKKVPVAWLPEVILSYSVVNGDDHYIEIEAYKKDSNNLEDCVFLLDRYEDILRNIGIPLEERIKESLFEIYYKKHHGL